MNSMNVRKSSFIIHLLRHTWVHILDTNPVNVKNSGNPSAVLGILGTCKIHTGEEYYEYTKCRKALFFIHCCICKNSWWRLYSYIVKKCGKAFHFFHFLENVKTLTVEKYNEYKKCGKFNCPSSLRAHVRTHWTWESLYFFHIPHIHVITCTGKKPHEYKECGETFTYSSGLTLQVRKHTRKRLCTWKLFGKV